MVLEIIAVGFSLKLLINPSKQCTETPFMLVIGAPPKKAIFFCSMVLSIMVAFMFIFVCVSL